MYACTVTQEACIIREEEIILWSAVVGTDTLEYAHGHKHFQLN